MEHKITFPFQARYFTLGNIENATEIWFVIHGYGQLAASFIRRFRSLESKNILVVAPEGLSRFYMQDVETRAQTGNNKVGATWMTKEDRLTDIHNYLTFLNSVFDSVTMGKKLPTTVLGFSQGAATATRWVINGKVNFERLILWAGILPPDIDFTTGNEILRKKKTYLVYGKNDPYLNDERFAEMNLLSEKLGVHPEVIEFEGGHEIDEGALQKLA